MKIGNCGIPVWWTTPKAFESSSRINLGHLFDDLSHLYSGDLHHLLLVQSGGHIYVFLLDLHLAWACWVLSEESTETAWTRITCGFSLIHSFLSSNHTKKRNFGFGRFYRICRYEYSTVHTSVFSMHITMYTYNLITQIYIWSNYYISRVVGRISYFKVWN